MTNRSDAEIRQLRRHLEHNFHDFITCFFEDIYYKDFIPNAATMAVAKALQTASTCPADAVINLPPGCGASTLLSFYAAWTIVYDSRSHIVLLSNSEVESRSLLHEVKFILFERHFRQVYPVIYTKMGKGFLSTYSGGISTVDAASQKILTLGSTEIRSNPTAFFESWRPGLVLADRLLPYGYSDERRMHATNKTISDISASGNAKIVTMTPRFSDNDPSSVVSRGTERGCLNLRIPAMHVNESGRYVSTFSHLYSPAKLMAIERKDPNLFNYQYQQCQQTGAL